jgi:hypothetical protein
MCSEAFISTHSRALELCWTVWRVDGLDTPQWPIFRTNQQQMFRTNQQQMFRTNQQQMFRTNQQQMFRTNQQLTIPAAQ